MELNKEFSFRNFENDFTIDLNHQENKSYLDDLKRNPENIMLSDTEKIEQENKELKNKIDILNRKITEIELEKNEFKFLYTKIDGDFKAFKKTLITKKNEIIVDCQSLRQDNEINLKQLNNTIISEMNQINQIKNDYKIIKIKHMDKPFDLTEELYCGPEIIKIKNFECSICLNIVILPIECEECENLFCSECIDTHLNTNNFCPSCKSKPFKKNKISRKLKQYLEEAEFSCPLKCGEIFKYVYLEKHQNTCWKIEEKLKCNLCENLLKVDYNISEKHIYECEKLKMNCVLCNEIIIKFDYKNHLETCQKYVFNCNECNINFTREFQNAHKFFYCKEIKKHFSKLSMIVEMFEDL